MVQSTVVPKGYMALELFFVQVSARTNKRHHHLHTNTMRGKYKKKLKQRKTSHQMHTATQRQERPCQAAPTKSFAATSAPWSSSVCTTARCPPPEAACKLVHPSWRAGVRSAAGPQRQERPRQAATLSRAGHPALQPGVQGGHMDTGESCKHGARPAGIPARQAKELYLRGSPHAAASAQPPRRARLRARVTRV